MQKPTLGHAYNVAVVESPAHQERNGALRTVQTCIVQFVCGEGFVEPTHTGLQSDNSTGTITLEGTALQETR